MLHENTIKKINFEIQEIETLFEKYGNLLKKLKSSTPDIIELTALASVIHSFYSGLEKIFLFIAKDIDGKLPSSSSWHRDLLLSMTKENENRNMVINSNTYDELLDFLTFRHYYRNAYSYNLEWDELKKLFNKISETWANIKTEINIFIDQLK